MDYHISYYSKVNIWELENTNKNPCKKIIILSYVRRDEDMGIRRNLIESIKYAVEGLSGKWKRYIILIICSIIFPLGMGYSLRIMKGINPAPEPDEYRRMFNDGYQMITIGTGYERNIWINIFSSASERDKFREIYYQMWFPVVKYKITSIIGIITSMTLFLILPQMRLVKHILIFICIICLSSYQLPSLFGTVRFARTETLIEAFNVKEIRPVIQKIGWITYITPLLMIDIFLYILGYIIIKASIFNFFILCLVAPFFLMVFSRYLSLLYDEGTV
jgi:hypothetical protein